MSRFQATWSAFAQKCGMLFLLAIPVVLCQSCRMLDAGPPISTQAIPVQHYRFQDGGQAIYFAFDKDLVRGVSTQMTSQAETFVFVISGSDCTSMQYFLPQYFRGLEGESGPLRIFILHKRFIEARTWGRGQGCSEDFIRADHPGRWIADQAEFIDTRLRIARAQSAMPKRIVLFGISEGGDVVPVLARRIEGVTHLVIVANGGMDPIAAYRLQAKKHGFTAALDALRRLDQVRPDDPDGAAHYIAGRTWRYWFELQQLKQTDNLLALSIPVWMAMGDADQSVPIESAWHIRDQFLLHGKSNLTLMAYPDADHSLRSKGVSRLPDFLHALDIFMQK